ncbi:site-specific integrase [Terrabacter sp. NPDC000476]|uniref:tyrosine-type recombinase/integrase n=1 Tax=Terrabacter sp. NPDC000476 TaxID=3154258 RepID=UPI00332EAE59
MAWTEKRSGGWLGRYRVDGIVKSTPVFKRKTDAKQAADRLEQEAKRGTYIDPKRGRMTVGDWADRWLASLEITPKTDHTYRELLGSLILPTWGSVPLSRIQLVEVKRWVASMRGPRGELSDARRRSAGAQLVRMLDAAVDEGIISANPARSRSGKVSYLPSAKRSKEHRYLTHAELEALARSCGEFAALVRLAGLTGLRWGEVTALRVSDVDLMRRRVTVRQAYSIIGGRKVLGEPKTHERRVLTVPPFLADSLTAQVAGKEQEDLVFSTASGEALDNTNFARRVLQPAQKAAGVERLTFHDLRHTAASLAVASGANVKAVQRMLGHASAAMTLDVYAGLFDTDAEELAERLSRAHRDAVAEDVAHYVPTSSVAALRAASSGQAS